MKSQAGELDATMSQPQIFISYDLDHDQDLCDLLIEQSGRAGLGFDVSGRSDRRRLRDGEHAGLRREIRKADQVIVICGEHTGESAAVFAELRIAQEEHKPYFLIWGRREAMCTKPEGAKALDGIYGWTVPNLREQITLAWRKIAADARATSLSRAKRP